MNSIWTKVDQYFNDRLMGHDAALETTLEANTHAELPAIDVSPSLGKLLHLLARMQSAKRILEIGTLGGYSTIWLARALPEGGKLITLELEPKHAEIAQENINRAGFSSQVEIMVGAAVDSMKALESANIPSFDFTFIDADKENIPAYFASALKLSRPGSVIVVDNVVRNGAVLEENSDDASVQGVRRFVEMLSTQSGAEAVAVQTVGTKGYDGFILVHVNNDGPPYDKPKGSG